MRIVFLGTSDFATPALRALAKSRHEVALVVSQPDRPSGRGQKTTSPPVAEAARALNLPLFQPERVNTEIARQTIAATGLDVVVLVSFGQLLKKKFLNLPRHGCLNVHGSVLPRHRGASPIQAAILAGDATTGVTIMRMDEGLDTGPIALIRETPVHEHTTAGELHDCLADLGAELIVEAIDRLESGELVFSPQPEQGVTHCSILVKDDGRLDPESSAAELDRRIRAMTPWPGAYWDLLSPDGVARWQVIRAHVHDHASSLPPGTIVSAERSRIVVSCGRGCLAVTEVKTPGKRAMTVAEYQNGHPIQPQSRFVAPARTPEKVENS